MKYYKNIEELIILKPFIDVKQLINVRHQFELRKIISFFGQNELRNRHNNIVNFIKFDVDSEIPWVDRLNIIRDVLKNDSSSLKSFVIRYGEKKGNEFFLIKNEKTKPSLEKYGIVEWKKKYNNYGNSLELYIKKYGNEDGIIKWNSYLINRGITYKKNKFNGKKYQNGRTLNEYIKRHGEIIGLEKYINRNNKQKYRFSINYYIDKYGEKDGNKKWDDYRKSMIKTTLNSFKKRYGNKIGELKYNELIKKLRYHNSLNYYISKYGDEDGEKKWNEYRNKTIFKKQKYSKISQELFWKVYKSLNDENKKESYFAEKNSEYFFRKNKMIIFADFKVKNVVVEFDGEYWHSLDNIKKKDIIKNNIYLDNGCSLLRVKERDYLNNKENVTKEVIKFINENLNE